MQILYIILCFIIYIYVLYRILVMVCTKHHICCICKLLEAISRSPTRNACTPSWCNRTSCARTSASWIEWPPPESCSSSLLCFKTCPSTCLKDLIKPTTAWRGRDVDRSAELHFSALSRAGSSVDLPFKGLSNGS